MAQPDASDFWRVYGTRRVLSKPDDIGKTDWWWTVGSNVPMGPYPDKAAAFLGLMEKVNDMQRQIADTLHSVLIAGVNQ